MEELKRKKGAKARRRVSRGRRNGSQKAAKQHDLSLTGWSGLSARIHKTSKGGGMFKVEDSM